MSRMTRFFFSLAGLLNKVLKADGVRAAVAVALGLVSPGLLLAQGWEGAIRSFCTATSAQPATLMCGWSVRQTIISD